MLRKHTPGEDQGILYSLDHTLLDYTERYLELSNIYNGVFWKNSRLLSGVNYLRKKLHLRCLTRF